MDLLPLRAIHDIQKKVISSLLLSWKLIGSKKLLYLSWRFICTRPRGLNDIIGFQLATKEERDQNQTMAPQEWDPLLPNADRDRGRNYTGILTKTIVYGITLVLFLIGACFLCARCSLLVVFMWMPSSIVPHSGRCDNLADKTILFLIAYAFTISSIILPSWVSYNSDKVC